MKSLNLFSLFFLFTVLSCNDSNESCTKDSFGFYNSISCLSSKKLLDENFVLLKWPHWYIKQDGHTVVQYEYEAKDNAVIFRAMYSINDKKLDSIRIAAILDRKNCKFISEFITTQDSTFQKAFIQNQTSGEIYLLGWNPHNGMSVYEDYIPQKEQVLQIDEPPI